MKLAACLIVKDSAETIERCLDSIRPHVDGVFVYDTGSTDGTLELLEKLDAKRGVVVSKETGERVHDQVDFGELVPDDPNVAIPLAPITVKQGEWRDDFAWAREQSFAMPPDEYDWIIWLDDDDEIVGAPNLRYLAATAHPSVDGFVLFYDYAQDENGTCICQLWRERLVRRDRGLHWLNPVHEVLTTKDGRPPNFVMVGPEQVRYVHHRVPDRYSSDRNLKILEREEERAAKEEREPDPRTLAYLGTELMAHNRLGEAVGYLERYLNHPEALSPDERAQVHHKLATCLRYLGNPTASVEVEFQGRRERDDWAENAVGLCESFAMLGQWERVEHWAKTALELGLPRSMLILNPLEFSFVPFVRLSEACQNAGRYDEARAWLDRANAVCPNHPLLDGRADQLARDGQQAEVVEAVLRLRETLVRHDENLKALELMENVPYVVADHPAIVAARADQRENCRHYLEPDEYVRWYAEEPKESTIGDEQVEGVGEFIARAKATLELAEQFEQKHGRKPRILDLGGNDMWLACYLWLHGKFVCDGVELNIESVEKGRKRMERFGAPGKLVQGDLHDAEVLLLTSADPTQPTYDDESGGYDLVLLYEVLEHVPDMARTLAVLESLVSPDGLVCLTTPNGAFEQGNLDHWHVVERKGHLRALPAHELADLLLPRGQIEEFVPQDGNRLTFAAYRPGRRKGTVNLYAGPSWEEWSPLSIQEGGLGGSETALVQLSVRLAQRGYRVKVYSGATPGLCGGALFRPFHAWDPTERCDLLVVSRLPHVFQSEIGARRAALWCHDHSYPGILTEEAAERMTDVVTLSMWERDRFARLYPFLDGKLRVIRNGITVAEPDGTSRFPDAERPFSERKPRVVYSSSADRGLDVLLTLWPQIREQVPDAELHVFYGWNVFDRVALGNPQLALYKARVLSLIAEAGGEEGGIFERGRVGQKELAAEMMQARVWGYPTAFLETSCIGAMESQASGLPIVTSGLGALNETVGTSGILLPWSGEEDEPHNATEVFGDAFVKHVIRLLTDSQHWHFWHRAARRRVASFDWERRIDLWERLIGQVEPQTTGAPALALAPAGR